jgi:hypothetical protein
MIVLLLQLSIANFTRYRQRREAKIVTVKPTCVARIVRILAE